MTLEEKVKKARAALTDIGDLLGRLHFALKQDERFFDAIADMNDQVVEQLQIMSGSGNFTEEETQSAFNLNYGLFALRQIWVGLNGEIPDSKLVITEVVNGKVKKVKEN